MDPRQSHGGAVMPNAPSFLTQTERLPPAAVAAADAGGAPPSGATVNGVRPMSQEEKNWCWAAVTQAVAASDATQQDIASNHLTSGVVCSGPHRAEGAYADCQPKACAGVCNAPHRLAAVLEEHAVLRGRLPTDPSGFWEALKAEIANDNPVPCRVDWNGRGGHFVTVLGWRVDAQGEHHVVVADPMEPYVQGRSLPASPQVRRLNDFLTAYRLGGSVGYVNFAWGVN